MWKALVILMSVLMFIVLGLPAMAEIHIYGDIDLEEDIRAKEGVEIAKEMDIDVKIDDMLVGTAEINKNGIIHLNQVAGSMNDQHNLTAVAAGNAIVAISDAELEQFNVGNYTEEILTYNYNIVSVHTLNNCAGITNVNQSAGSRNNQSSVSSISAPFALILNFMQ